LPIVGKLPLPPGTFSNRWESSPDIEKAFPVLGIFSRSPGKLSRRRETIPSHPEALPMPGQDSPPSGKLSRSPGILPDDWERAGEEKGSFPDLLPFFEN